MTPMTEDTLVQQTTAAYLEHQLRWDPVYAYNTETFGPDGTLGRASDRDIVLNRYLRAKLIELNPSLPESAYTMTLFGRSWQLAQHKPFSRPTVRSTP